MTYTPPKETSSRLLPQIDGRTIVARRVTEIALELIEDIGDPSSMQLTLIKQAATLAAVLEKDHADMLQGKDVDNSLILKRNNTLIRTLQTLGIRRNKSNKPRHAHADIILSTDD